MSTNITFLDALNDRYGSEDTTEYDSSAFLVGFGGKKAKNNKQWEFVGMEKTRKQQSHHGRLQTIVLKDAMISVPEKNAGEIREAAIARATEVDLSGNFELSVEDVKVIVDSIPKLQLLQLNRIPLLLTNEERVGLKEKLIAEGRIEVIKKVGAKNEDETELLAKVLPDLPSCFLLPAAANNSRLLTAAWPNLKQLVLNGTGITSLLPLRGLVLPNCEEIHLDMNNIQELFPSVAGAAAEGGEEGQTFAGLAGVSIVSLALNKLSNWSGTSGLQLLAAKAFPKLTSLAVGGNPLPNLPLEALAHMNVVGEATATSTITTLAEDNEGLRQLKALFSQLTVLDISDCAQINNHVSSLDAIRTFGSSISTLRVSYENLFADKSKYPTEAIARNLTIASLPNLMTLNRAVVRPKERVDAELYLVQRCLSEMPELRKQQFATAADSDSDALPTPATPTEVATMTFDQLTAGIEDPALISQALAAYPRYFELRQLYRHVILAQSRGGAAGSGVGGADAGGGFMVDVTIRADAFPDQNKRLPTSITIQKVKALAAALFSGLDAQQMEVSFWVTAGRGDSVAVPLVLDNEMQSLGFYGVPNRATIKIRDLRDKLSK